MLEVTVAYPHATCGNHGRTERSYTPITRLDDRTSRSPVPENRYIARSPDGDRTVLVSVPPPSSDPQRYTTEADASRYLLGPWASPATEFAAPGDSPWHARPYLPALPLPTALAVHDGPLAEHTVRALRRRPRRDARRRARAEPHARRCLPVRRTARRRRAPPHLLRRGALRGAGRDLALRAGRGLGPGQPPARAGVRRPTATARRRLRAGRGPGLRGGRAHRAGAG